MWENIGYLIVYSFTDFMNGIILQTPGPLIPFLAARAHVKATSYYYVFICRALGAVVSALLYKYLEGRGWVSNHNRVLGISSMIFFLLLMIFYYWHTMVGIGVLIGLYAGLYFVQNLAYSISLVLVSSKEYLYLNQESLIIYSASTRVKDTHR